MRIRPLFERLAEPGILTGGVHRAGRVGGGGVAGCRGRAWLACVCLALVCAPHGARADSPAPTAELQTRLEGVDLVLNGAGARNFLFFDIYEVALYLPRKLSDPRDVLRNDLPRRLRITLLRDMHTERDLEALRGGLEANNSAEELAAVHDQVEYFLRLIRAMGKIPKGSIVRLDFLPEVGTRVWLNQRLLGVVSGAAFNRAVLKIWLGDQPIQENLKKALLGEARQAI